MIDPRTIEYSIEKRKKIAGEHVSEEQTKPS